MKFSITKWFLLKFQVKESSSNLAKKYSLNELLSTDHEEFMMFQVSNIYNLLMFLQK